MLGDGCKMWIEYNRFALSDGGRYALNVKNESGLTATATLNCRAARGGIRSGCGVEAIRNVYGESLYVPSDAKTVLAITGWQRAEGLDTEYAFISEAGDIYVYSGTDDDLTKINLIHKGYTELFRDICDPSGKRMIALCPNGVCIFTRHGRLTEYSGNCTGTGCVFHNRLFIADENAVCFSDVDSYTDFSESVQGGGKIEFTGEGPVQKLITYRDSVLVFMQDSIVEFHAKGAADEFLATPIAYYGHRIAKETIAKCGDNILFITCAGELYCLHGNSCRKIAENVPSAFYAEGVRAAGNGELYFITSEDGRTFVADVDGGCYCLDYALTGLTPCAGEAVGVYAGTLRKMQESGGVPSGKKCVFTVENWLEKDGRERQIERLRLYGAGEVTARVQGLGGEVSRTVALAESGVEIPIGVRGKKFRLGLELGSNSKIWKLDAHVCDIGGGK